MTEIINRIDSDLKQKDRIIVAIDGRCASGKTTLANNLLCKYNCNVIHMDDFFLRKEQRTKERLDEPGGNSDRERFLKEVLIPLFDGKDFSYRKFNCSTMSLGEEKRVNKNKITIVEGTYSCHPDLFSFYDLHIFCDADYNTQVERLKLRCPEKLDDFLEKWIPMEEKYFSYYNIKEKCDIIRFFPSTTLGAGSFVRSE